LLKERHPIKKYISNGPERKKRKKKERKKEREKRPLRYIKASITTSLVSSKRFR
jgi:hypothetical protein